MTGWKGRAAVALALLACGDPTAPVPCPVPPPCPKCETAECPPAPECAEAPPPPAAVVKPAAPVRASPAARAGVKSTHRRVLDLLPAGTALAVTLDVARVIRAVLDEGLGVLPAADPITLRGVLGEESTNRLGVDLLAATEATLWVEPRERAIAIWIEGVEGEPKVAAGSEAPAGAARIADEVFAARIGGRLVVGNRTGVELSAGLAASPPRPTLVQDYETRRRHAQALDRLRDGPLVVTGAATDALNHLLGEWAGLQAVGMSVDDAFGLELVAHGRDPGLVAAALFTRGLQKELAQAIEAWAREIAAPGGGEPGPLASLFTSLVAAKVGALRKAEWVRSDTTSIQVSLPGTERLGSTVAAVAFGALLVGLPAKPHPEPGGERARPSRPAEDDSQR